MGQIADVGPSLLSDAEMAAIGEMSPLAESPRDRTNHVSGNEEAIRLGRALFFDKRLSRQGTVACATCHDPSKGWADGHQLPATGGLDRHVPTLLNVAYQRWWFWDGHADTLWAQITGPLEGLQEHGGSRLEYAHFIAADSQLRGAYENLFGPLPDLSNMNRFPARGCPRPDGPDDDQRAWLSMRPEDREVVNVVFTNIAKSIAAFVETIVTGPSPFDVFAHGVRTRNAAEIAALNARALRGFKLFVGRANCRLCHNGPNFSDGEFHDIGVRPLRGEPGPGRYSGIARLLASEFNGGSRYSDSQDEGAKKLALLDANPDVWGQFKTPSLRSVALTAPYMHQGQLLSLHDVVRYYSRMDGSVEAEPHGGEHILAPLRLADMEVDDIVAFLESLTGSTNGPSAPGIEMVPRSRANP
jgi:cytochrome c peroxidase